MVSIDKDSNLFLQRDLIDMIDVVISSDDNPEIDGKNFIEILVQNPKEVSQNKFSPKIEFGRYLMQLYRGCKDSNNPKERKQYINNNLLLLLLEEAPYDNGEKDEIYKEYRRLIQEESKRIHAIDKSLFEEILLTAICANRYEWKIIKAYDKTIKKLNQYGIECRLIEETRIDKDTGKKTIFTYCTYTGNSFEGRFNKEDLFRISNRVESLLEPLDDIFEIEENELPKEKELQCEDIIVKGNTFSCVKNHQTEDVVAQFRIIGKSGDIILYSVTAVYCCNCNAYFISNQVYEEVQKMGVLLHRVVSQNAFETKSYLITGDEFELAEESPLHQMGYNVNQQQDLSEKERRLILECMIDNEILSRGQVVNYLNSFIKRNGNKRNMGLAISKWESDREHISHYEKNKLRWINVRNIKL